MYKVENT